MNDRRNIDRDENIPEGTDFLRGVLRFTAKCESSTDEYLALESPQGPINTHQHLGTLFSLLDRASSCWWGCRQGDHAAEMLVGRCCSYGLCAFKLARSGFYDESVSLARTVGEITNLAVLFVTDPSVLLDWRTADERTRRDKYSPVAVRRTLEAKSHPVPIDQTRYGQLSAKAVHLTPTIPPQMYNAERHPNTGGYFQEAGLCFGLAEIGYPFSILGLCAVQLCGLSAENGAKVCRTADALSKSLHAVRSRVNASFPGTYS
jgi:hypothetical protein